MVFLVSLLHFFTTLSLAPNNSVFPGLTRNTIDCWRLSISDVMRSKLGTSDSKLKIERINKGTETKRSFACLIDERQEGKRRSLINPTNRISPAAFSWETFPYSNFQTLTLPSSAQLAKTFLIDFWFSSSSTSIKEFESFAVGDWRVEGAQVTQLMSEEPWAEMIEERRVVLGANFFGEGSWVFEIEVKIRWKKRRILVRTERFGGGIVLKEKEKTEREEHEWRECYSPPEKYKFYHLHQQ